MPSMDIYTLLENKNVITRIALRYIKFILSCNCNPNDEYTERHHIFPASIYPEFKNLKLHNWNEKILTARQHFIAHCMLSKMYIKNTEEFYSMVKAFTMMCSQSSTHANNRYINSILYEQNRNNMKSTMSAAQSGNKNSQFGLKWVTNTITGDSFKSKTLPEDCVFGRNVKFKTCKCCGVLFTKYTKYCSKICADIMTTRALKENTTLNAHSMKPVMTLDGIKFDSVKSCAIHFNKSEETIRLWIKSGKILPL